MWKAFAVVTAALLLGAGILWMLDNPESHSSDEAFYFNRVIDDAQRVHAARSVTVKLDTLVTVKLETLIRTLLDEDRGRPPAYRLLVFPLVYAIGFSSLSVRLFSFMFFVATIGLTYLTVRRVARPASAALGALFIALCPGMIFQSMTFGTEYPLFLATSAMLYFLVSAWNSGRDSITQIVGLGLCLALGALAKSSFLLIGGPPLLLTLILVLMGRITAPTPKALLGSGLVGLLIVWPWWALNLRPAAIFARGARNFYRHALDSTPIAMLWDWLMLFIQTGFGPALAIVAMLVLAAWGLERSRGRRNDADPSPPGTQSTIAFLCLLSPAPLIIAHLSSKNQNIMHVTPIMPFIAVGLGVLADSIQWQRKKVLSASIAGLLVAQLAMTLWPLAARVVLPLEPPQSSGRPPWYVYARMDSWDLTELMSLSRAHGLETPSISFLGNARSFGSAHIAFPWLVAGIALPSEPRWLWWYEDGPIDWDKVSSSIASSDLVLTVPGYVGMRSDKQDLDNQHNGEFAARLERDGQFCAPAVLQVGRFEKVSVLVFARRSSLRGGCEGFTRSTRTLGAAS